MRSVPLAPLINSISAQTGLQLVAQSLVHTGGGDINRAVRVTDATGRHWFLKFNSAACADMFAAESEGLLELAATDAVRVPEPRGHGSTASYAWLLLEWLELSGNRADAALGQALARLHRHTSGEFGWHRDNYIGTTAQLNRRVESWPEFFRDYRLGYQLQLAAANGAQQPLTELGEQLLQRLDTWFVDYTPLPSLVHGDLWGGNKGSLADGTPVLFDPAVYYGDREVDLAMTSLFGGFSAEFYTAYEKEWPLHKGAGDRQDLYNLYHVLNHFNLFGGAYLTQAEILLGRLLSAG